MNRYKYIDEGRKHLHTLDGKPLIGGSTLKSIVGKGEVLMQWYADMCAVAGLAMPQQDIKAEYDAVQAIYDGGLRAKAKKALDEKYPNYAIARRSATTHRDKKAVEGTARHATLQDYINACLERGGTPIDVNRDFRDKGELVWTKEILAFVDWSLENVGQFHFTEANCYNEPLWVGGIADLGLTLKDGRRLVGDHKSSKEAYQDQFLQCAIYDTLLSHSGGLDRDGNKLFDWELADGYVVFPFRSEPFTPEFRWNVDEFRRGVESVAQLYKLIEL